MEKITGSANPALMLIMMTPGRVPLEVDRAASYPEFVLNQRSALLAHRAVIAFRKKQTARIHNSWRDHQPEFVAWLNFHSMLIGLAYEGKVQRLGLGIINSQWFDNAVQWARAAATRGFLPENIIPVIADLLLELQEEIWRYSPETLAFIRDNALPAGQKWVDE